MIEIVGLYALWGTSLPMSKHLLNFTSPTVLTALRMTISGVLLFIINHMRSRSFVPLNSAFWWYNSQIILAVFLKYQLRNWSLAHMPASKLSFMLNMAPFVVAMFAYVAFKEKLTKLQWLGLFIGFLGMVPLIMSSSQGEEALGEFLYISWPEVAVVAAVCVDAYSVIISRILIREHKQSIILSNGVRMIGAGGMAFATLFFMGIPLQITDHSQFFGWLSLVIAVSNVICHNYRSYLLKYYSVTFLAFTDFISPLFTALYSWLFLQEVLTWHYFLSVVIIAFGLSLFYRDELKTVYQA